MAVEPRKRGRRKGQKNGAAYSDDGQTKRCSECKTDKPVDDFYYRGDLVKGDKKTKVYTGLCKKCMVRYNHRHKLKKRLEEQGENWLVDAIAETTGLLAEYKGMLKRYREGEDLLHW